VSRPRHDLPAPVSVVWHRSAVRPSAFVWQHRRLRIDRVLQRWAIDTGWWDEKLRIDRRYFRVEAGGRLFDLCFDRLRRRWYLVRQP
jgi:hypothetical protein